MYGYELKYYKSMQLSSDDLARFPPDHTVSTEKPNRVNNLGVADIQHKPCRQPV